MKTIKADCYLTILPKFRGDKVVGAKIAKVTTQMPRTPAGAPVIHLRLEMPASVLEPLEVLLVATESEISIIPTIIEEELE